MARLRNIMARTFRMVRLKLVMLLVLSSAAAAHELRPAVADVVVGADEVTLIVTLNAEAMLAGVDQAAETDTNDAPEAEAYDAFRALSDDALGAEFRDAWPGLADGFQVLADGAQVALSLETVEVVPEPDTELPRDAVVRARGVLPPGTLGVALGWSREYGPLIIRQVEAGDDAFQGFLMPGDLTPPLPTASSGGGCHWSIAWLGVCG